MCWVRHQRTGKTRVLNREKLTIVDPNIGRDTVRTRPRRNPRRSVVPNVNDGPLPMLQKVNKPFPDKQVDDRQVTMEPNRPVPAKVVQMGISAPSAPKRHRSERIANQNQSMTNPLRSPGEPMETETYVGSDQNEYIEVDPVVPAFRKRHTTGGPSCQEQKRARCDAIATVISFYA